jgi:hypothetical protein
VSAVTAPPLPAGLESLIVSDFPPLFEEFRAKHFNLLWRGSRDGFTALEFHHRCDGRANSLALISDTKRNIFGGFTPVKWESVKGDGDGMNCYKGDDSLRSFLFTLRNPRGVPPRKFALRAESKQFAIDCTSERGPVFGGCICVDENCNNTNTYNHTSYFGSTYDNISGGREENFLTAAVFFTVKEIEVFEIAD